MSNITIKTADISLEVFSKAGESMGTFTGQQAIGIQTYLENPTQVPFIKVSNTDGETKYINSDSIAHATSTLTMGTTTFDDMSEPMAEIHPATEITVDKATLSVAVGATDKVTATAPWGAPVKWSSLDEAVATVDQNGTVTGVSAGKATIVVETKDPSKHYVKQIDVTVTAGT